TASRKTCSSPAWPPPALAQTPPSRDVAARPQGPATAAAPALRPSGQDAPPRPPAAGRPGRPAWPRRSARLRPCLRCPARIQSPILAATSSAPKPERAPALPRQLQGLSFLSCSPNSQPSRSQQYQAAGAPDSQVQPALPLFATDGSPASGHFETRARTAIIDPDSNDNFSPALLCFV